MPSRFCIHYVSKSGRPSSGHKAGKGRSWSQFPRRVVLKNVLTIGQLHSSPMLVRSCLKSCMLGFSIMGTKNFQMSKLGLETEEEVKWGESHSIMSNSLWPQGLYSPWNSLGQNTGVGSLSLLQRIFPTQGSNPGLLHRRRILYQLSHKGSPNEEELEIKLPTFAVL